MTISKQSTSHFFNDSRLRWIAPLLIVLTCLLTFSNALNSGFLMDDYPRLLNNTDFLHKNFLDFDLKSLKSQVYLRPVTEFFNFVTFVMFDKKAVAYHLLNLLIFTCAGLALYRLMQVLFERRLLSLFTAMLFCTHPINSVAVNYKNATSFSFMILALCLSVLHYVIFLKENKSVMRFLLSLIWFTLAIFCHEVVVAFPLYVFAALYCSKQFSFKQSFAAAVPFGLLVVGFVVLRSHLLHSEANVLSYIKLYAVTFPEYIASYARLIVWYITKLITLDGIVLAWDTPIIRQGLVTWIIGTILAALAALVIVFSKRCTSPYRFGVAWLAIGCIPIALACFSRPFLGFVIQSHWLFYSSIGFCVILAETFLKVRQPFSVIFFSLFILLFATSTHTYNKHWHSEESYGQYWLSVSPANFWPNFWLGHYYLNHGQYERARKHFQTIEGTPFRQSQIRGNLGIIALKLNNLKEAQQYFSGMLKSNYADAQTHFYLGATYFKMEDYKNAEHHLKGAIHFDRLLRNPRELLVELYVITGRAAEADLMRKDLDNLQ